MKILLFEFDPVDQDEIGNTLLDLGNEVYVESDEEKALARIEAEEIRVVIGDGRLPKFGWRGLVRRVRSDPNKPYIYFILTADPRTDDSHEEWAAESGVDDFLSSLEERELKRRLRMAHRIVEAVLRLW